MKERFRILMPSIYFPPRIGGIESHVYYLARELVRRGHMVFVVTTRTENDSKVFEEVDGILVKRTRFWGQNPRGWIVSSIGAVPSTVSNARSFDLIHCHTFAFALGGSIGAFLAGKPLVVTVHSSHFLRLVRKRIARLGLKAVLRRSDFILSTSKEIDSQVRSLLPGKPTMPVVNGIDTDLFKPTEPSLPNRGSEFLIVCPRRLVEKTGVEFLIRAIPLVKDEINVKVFIAGDGPLRKGLESLASELGVRERVVFLGSVPNQKMPGIYSSCDLVIIPSLIEATSIAALEAMSCGKPVAASDVGGLPEIIDRRTGLLFEPRSAEAIANAIRQAARRTDLKEIGERARKLVKEKWSIEAMVDIHEDIYRDLLRVK
ncbi:MAG: glycosyltransferase family 4 protein [bacterium]